MLKSASETFALAEAWHVERVLLQTRIERLHAVLREHGIPPPEDDPRLGVSDGEHLEQCRAVVSAAYELLARLEDLQAIVGSGMELIRDQAAVPRLDGGSAR